MAADKVNIQFNTVGKDCAPVYHASGAVGGPIEDGSVMMWAFIESRTLPGEQLGEIDGKTGTLTLKPFSGAPTDKLMVDRQLQCGLVMTAEKARIIGKWLIDQADGAKKVHQQVAKKKIASAKTAPKASPKAAAKR